jgi:hypothetical protein
MTGGLRRRKDDSIDDASNGSVRERIAALEEQMEHLMGNGQPGVLAQLTASVQHLASTVTTRFTKEDEREKVRQEMELQRQRFANKWWKRVALIAGIGASIASITSIEAPTIRHFLHSHGFTFVQDSTADVKTQSMTTPQAADLPYAARR